MDSEAVKTMERAVEVGGFYEGGDKRENLVHASVGNATAVGRPQHKRKSISIAYSTVCCLTKPPFVLVPFEKYSTCSGKK